MRIWKIVAGITVLLGSMGCPDTRSGEGDEDDDDSALAQDDDDSTAGDDDDSAPANRPPEITSDPPTPFELTLALPSNFTPDQMFLSSSRTDEVRVYETSDLAFVQSFTHALFSDVNNTLFTYGPNGVAFNERGNLVVAAYSAFVEFSDYGVEYATYPKVTDEATENLLFDRLGNLYTTTATGGSDLLNQYRAVDYAFEQTIMLPAGAGQFTGITFDDGNRLYVASQSDDTIHVAEADATFSTFTWVDTISGGNPRPLEGLQFNGNGDLIVAAGDMAVYDVSTGLRTNSFDSPDDAWPVPVRVDNEGAIYTADYENGTGTAPADIFKFAPDGSSWITRNDPDLFGPFGGAISGTVLAGDPPVEYVYAPTAVDPDGDTLTWTLLAGPVGMTLSPTTGALSWWVTSAQLGSWPVSIQAADGRGGTDVQDYSLEISGS
ncbi:MAG: hypothetical protein GY898_21860 [Proteobacteria bacterium]|nr:hypothetical protein [Pseudomonadota bacterium]